MHCILFLVVSVLPTYGQRADWPCFKHDSARTGLSPLAGDMDTVTLLWSYGTGYDVESSLALGDVDGDGELEAVVGSYDGNLYAINGEDGSVLWVYETPGWFWAEIHSSPALGDIDDDGKIEIAVGSNNDTVYVVDGVSVGIKEEQKQQQTLRVSPVVHVYPNPFSTIVQVHFNLLNDTKVNIAIYSLSGEKVITLAQELKKAGYHTVIWNGQDKSRRKLPSGIYFCRIQMENLTRVEKMVLIRQ